MPRFGRGFLDSVMRMMQVLANLVMQMMQGFTELMMRMTQGHESRKFRGIRKDGCGNVEGLQGQ